jgi:UDP-glucose 4-epimerase
MKILVTGSAGHLGRALARTLRRDGHTVVGLDIAASDETDVIGSITDRRCVHRCMQGVNAVLHTATLHKPRVATHSRQEFVDTNICAFRRSRSTIPPDAGPTFRLMPVHGAGG